MYKPLSETESNRLAAIQMIYESVKSRMAISFENFKKILEEWKITPLMENGWIIGGVMEKGNELHIGYGIKPTASIRGHLRQTIEKVINKHGFAITSVKSDNKSGLNFCKRLGFVEIGQEQDKIMMKCDRCNYV